MKKFLLLLCSLLSFVFLTAQSLNHDLPANRLVSDTAFRFLQQELPEANVVAETCTFSINCPAPVTICSVSPTAVYVIDPLQITSSGCNLVVTYNVADANGNSIRIGSGTNASGTFPVGTNTVTWSVREFLSPPKTCSTVVVVKQVPTIQIQTSKFVYCNGDAGQPVTFNVTPSGTPFSWTTQTNIGFGTQGSNNISGFTATNNTPVLASASLNASATLNGCSTTVAQSFYVTSTPHVDSVADKIFCDGDPVGAITFSGDVNNTVFGWNAAGGSGIGINPETGSSTIPAFTAVNNTSALKTATVTVLPSVNQGQGVCTGPQLSFTITVYPAPEIEPLSDLVLCSGDPAGPILFQQVSPPIPGVQYSYTVRNLFPPFQAVDVGFGSGAVNVQGIPQFIGSNNTNTPITAEVTVIATSPQGCEDETTFLVTIYPTPEIEPINNLILCNGDPAGPIPFRQVAAPPIPGVQYSYVVRNAFPPFQGLNVGFGFGAVNVPGIPGFIARNNTNNPITVEVTVTATSPHGCKDEIAFFVTVLPCGGGDPNSYCNPVNYYSKPAGSLHNVLTWGTDPDGSGLTPPDFGFGKAFNLANRSAYTMTGNWAVNGILNLPPGSQLQLNGFVLSVRDVTGTGTFTGSLTSDMVVLPTICRDSTVLNFTAGGHNLNDLTVDTGAYAALGTPLNVYGVLTVNGRFNTTDLLTLKSNATRSAIIAPVLDTIMGKATVEQYVPARRAWRLINAPVLGAQSVHQAWQEGAPAVSSNPNPGFGTHITGGSAANGFDETGCSGSSIKTYNSAVDNWLPLGNTNTAPAGTVPYMLFIRGDRSVNISCGSAPAATNTTLRAYGALRTGSTTFAVNANGFTAIPNPYQAPINFATLVKNNVENSFYVWDPKLNGVNGVGDYVRVSWNGTSYVVTPTPVSPITQYIQPWQSFFVRSTGAAGSLTINETDKVLVPAGNVFRINNNSGNANGKNEAADLMVQRIPQGDPDEGSEKKKQWQVAEADLMILVSPVPSTHQFTVEVKGPNRIEKVSLRIVDVSGRLLEIRNNLSIGQTITVGAEFDPGIYFVEAIQGINRRTVKIIKLAN